MKPKLSRQPLRLLVLGVLCVVPPIASATSAVAKDGFESVVHVRQAWLDKAGPEGWAGDRFSMSVVQLGPRDTPSASAADKVFARDAWSAHFLSKPSESSSFANITTPVPEPETYLLMVVGLAVFGFFIRRRRGG